MADLRRQSIRRWRPRSSRSTASPRWIIESRVSVIDTYNVIPGFFDIVHSQNRGVAFGIFNDSTCEWRTTLLVVAFVAAVIFVGVHAVERRRSSTAGRCGASR